MTLAAMNGFRPFDANPAPNRFQSLNSLRKTILSAKGPTKSGTKLVLVAILEFAGPGCVSYPSQETLAACTGMSVRSVRSRLNEAERTCWLSRGQRRNAKGRNWYHTVYIVHTPQQAAEIAACVPVEQVAANYARVPAQVAD